MPLPIGRNPPGNRADGALREGSPTRNCAGRPSERGIFGRARATTSGFRMAFGSWVSPASSAGACTRSCPLFALPLPVQARSAGRDLEGVRWPSLASSLGLPAGRNRISQVPWQAMPQCRPADTEIAATAGSRQVPAPLGGQVAASTVITKRFPNRARASSSLPILVAWRGSSMQRTSLS